VAALPLEHVIATPVAPAGPPDAGTAPEAPPRSLASSLGDFRDTLRRARERSAEAAAETPKKPG
ncbi:MAG: hypothetical protein LW860_20715, partial [Xanthomonadaceae bacterium]|jgi:hypothetical protein|nr:hypothetical protein [Xanthomonadaceae bacterium]